MDDDTDGRAAAMKTNGVRITAEGSSLAVAKFLFNDTSTFVTANEIYDGLGERYPKKTVASICKQFADRQLVERHPDDVTGRRLLAYRWIGPPLTPSGRIPRKTQLGRNEPIPEPTGRQACTHQTGEGAASRAATRQRARKSDRKATTSDPVETLARGNPRAPEGARRSQGSDQALPSPPTAKDQADASSEGRAGETLHPGKLQIGLFADLTLKLSRDDHSLTLEGAELDQLCLVVACGAQKLDHASADCGAYS
jgi:hypothetical protein